MLALMTFSIHYIFHERYAAGSHCLSRRSPEAHRRWLTPSQTFLFCVIMDKITSLLFIPR